MTIKELVPFETQLVQVETTSIKAEKLQNEINSTFSISVNVKGEIKDQNTGYSRIRIGISNDSYVLEVEKLGKFEFNEEIVDETSAIQFMELQGIRILWSYLREDIYSISGKMLKQPIMIPTIDVLKTMENAEENED